MAVHSADSTRSDASGTVALGAVGALAVGVAVVANPATIENGPVICPFRLLTGLPCPGCGLTRSWVYLVHGDWLAALQANPFGYLTLAATLTLIVAVVVAWARGRAMPSLTPIVRSRTMKVVVGVWLLFAVVRLIVVATG